MVRLRLSTTAVVIGAIIAKGAGTMIAIVRSTVTETAVGADFEPYRSTPVDTALWASPSMTTAMPGYGNLTMGKPA